MTQPVHPIEPNASGAAGEAFRTATCPSDYAPLLQRHDRHTVVVDGEPALLLTASPRSAEPGRFRFGLATGVHDGCPAAPDVVQDLVTAMAVFDSP